MILVGEATEIEHVDERLRVTFRCRTQEIFILWMSPALTRFETYATVRLHTDRIPNEDGTLSDEHVILHWEDLM